jgi:hypothetical protein
MKTSFDEILCLVLLIQQQLGGIHRGYHVQQRRRPTTRQSQSLIPRATVNGYHQHIALNQEEKVKIQYGPQVGASYNLKTKIPVIGIQTFQLRILSEDIAELVINGVLGIKDTIHYKVDQQSGELSFSLSERTKMVLKRFRTKLLKVTYCPQKDMPSIIVRPPLPMNLTLHLNRQL